MFFPRPTLRRTETVDLGDVSLLPGLVEGHTHIPCPPRIDAFDIISEEPNANRR